MAVTRARLVGPLVVLAISLWLTALGTAGQSISCAPPGGVFAFDVESESKLKCINVATGAVADVLDFGLDANVLVSAAGDSVFLTMAANGGRSFAPVVVSTTNSTVSVLGSYPAVPGASWQPVAGGSMPELYLVGCTASALTVYRWSTFAPQTAPTLLGTLTLSPDSGAPSCLIVPLSAAYSDATNELAVVLDEFSDSYRHQTAVVTRFNVALGTWTPWVAIAPPVTEVFVGLFYDGATSSLLTFDQTDNLWAIDVATGAVSKLANFAVPGDFLSGVLFFPPGGSSLARTFLALSSNFGPSTSSSGSGSAFAVTRASADGTRRERDRRRAPHRAGAPPLFVVSLATYDVDSGALLSSVQVNVSRFSQLAVDNGLTTSVPAP